jgi:ABC-2 type transport system permease protein
MGAWLITVKDLRTVIKDRGALFTLLALPVVVIAIIGMSTGQLLTAHEETKLIRMGFVDESGSKEAQHVFQDLSAIGGMKIEKLRDRDEANMQLQNGSSSMVVILGKDFENKVDELEPGDVLDPENGRLAQGLSAIDVYVQSGVEFAEASELVQYVVFAAVLRAVAPEVMRRNRLIARFVNRMIEHHGTAHQAANGKGLATVNASGSIIYQKLVPAFLVMFAFFLVNIMAISFISERRLGTLRRLRMSQITPVQLLLGKTLPYLFISIVQSVLLFVAGKLMFGMSWGNRPEMLLAVIAATSISATGMGLLLATNVQTEAQVSSYSTFLVVVLAGISGCYMPRAWLPALMQKLSLATPHAWALIAYDELLTRSHPDLRLVGECCGVMAAMGIICFTIGAWQFRRTAGLVA